MNDSDRKGFNCFWCGQYHEFGVYVAAHWSEKLIHTCECEATHVVQWGYVKLKKQGKRKHMMKPVKP